MARHLIRKGSAWYARVVVPADVRSVVGKTAFWIALGVSIEYPGTAEELIAAGCGPEEVLVLTATAGIATGRARVVPRLVGVGDPKAGRARGAGVLSGQRL